MDGVDVGSILSSMAASGPSKAAPAGDVDSQILSLLKQTAPAPDAQATPQSENAQAAQTAYTNAKHPTLHVGLGPFLNTDTHIPIPQWLDQGLVGAGAHVMRDIGAARDPMSQAVASQADQTTAGKVGGFLGDTGLATAATLPVGGLMGAAGLGRLAANPYALSAVEGGVQGALTSPDDRLKGGILGAVTNPALTGVGRGLSKVVQGINRTPEAQQLLDRGISVTPGMASPTGLVNRVEQAGTHIFPVGGKIANAREALPGQVSQRMFEDAAAPGVPLGRVGSPGDAVSQLEDGFNQAYDRAVGGYPASAQIIRVKGGNVNLRDALQDVIDTPRTGMPANARAATGQKALDNLQALLDVAKQKGGMQMTDLQQLRSTFRTLSREAPESGSTLSSVQDFWHEMAGKVTDAMESQLPAHAASDLRAIDSQYGKLSTVRAFSTAAKDGTGTLNAWSNAIRQTTPGNVYARGGGFNRDLVSAAQSVYKPTVTHTGALGAGTIAPIAGALETLTHPSALIAHPGLAAAGGGLIGGVLGAYTKPGMRAILGQTGVQKGAQAALKRIPAGARASLMTALQAGALQSAQPAGLLQAGAQ